MRVDAHSIRVIALTLLSATVIISKEVEGTSFGVGWTSTGAKVASVGNDGVVAPVGTGSAMIVASVGGLADTAMVTVTSTRVRRYLPESLAFCAMVRCDRALSRIGDDIRWGTRRMIGFHHKYRTIVVLLVALTLISTGVYLGANPLRVRLA